jgi:N-acetylglutamate synthase
MPEPRNPRVEDLERAAAAADRGASRVLLQVETDNAPARALYSRCGFRESHRYHYMLAP